MRITSVLLWVAAAGVLAFTVLVIGFFAHLGWDLYQ